MDTVPHSLSVAIISFNEEARILRCLESVRTIAREIIVVDALSTDNTVAIAESMGATVFSEKWKGFVDQRNSVLDKCTGDWVLFIDCDEVLSDTLCQSIVTAIGNGTGECNSYKLQFISCFMGRWITHAWGQDWHTRLIRRGTASWTGHGVHETLQCQHPMVKLEGVAYHYTYQDYEQHMAKGVHYAALGAAALCLRGKKVRLYRLITNPLWIFIKQYILKLGFLDGFPGLILCLTSVHHNFYKYLIAWEMQHNEALQPPVDRLSGMPPTADD